MTLPIDGNLYDIGRDLIVMTTTDEFPVAMATTFKILNIEYNFDEESVTYRGPGITL